MADYDVAIVGCGPAGMTAAIYAARANMKVLLLDKLAPGGQIVNTFEIGNYPGMEKVGGADLAISMFEHTQKLEVAFDYATVEEILDEGEEKILSCKEGQRISCRAVILATGTRPRMLGVPPRARLCRQRHQLVRRLRRGQLPGPGRAGAGRRQLGGGGVALPGRTGPPPDGGDPL